MACVSGTENPNCPILKRGDQAVHMAGLALCPPQYEMWNNTKQTAAEWRTILFSKKRRPDCADGWIGPCPPQNVHTSRICIHSPMTLRGEHDGSPRLQVHTARDPMHFPMSVLVVLAAVEHGETFPTAQSRWCSAKRAVRFHRSGEYAGYCFMLFLCRSAQGFQVAGCQIRQNVKL